MKEKASPEIQRLKKELHKAETAHAHWHALMPERESLQEIIQQMQNQIEEAKASFYKQSIENQHDISDFEKEVEKQCLLLSRTKKKKQEIDHLLDVLEEGSEEKIQSLRKQLIEAILSHHQDQEPVYAKMEKEQARIALLLSELHETIQICAGLQQMLEIIHITRQSVKKQGVFRYLIGKNPNVLIGQQLQDADQLCEMALPLLEKHHASKSKQESLSALYKEIKSFLLELRKHCKKRWGFKTIDTIFSPALTTASRLHQEANEQLALCAKSQETVDQNIAAWINAHS